MHGTVFFPPSSATRSMIARRPVAVPGMGQIASNSPAGWIRRMGSDRSAWAGSTTQAWLDVGQKRPHRQRPAPRLVDLVRTQQLERIFVSSFNQLADRIQRRRRSHTNLLAGERGRGQGQASNAPTPLSTSESLP